MRLTSPALPIVILTTGVLACGTPPSADSSSSNETSSTTPGDGDGDGGDESPQIICTPGDTHCVDDMTIEICAPTGLEWVSMPCEGYETCDANFTDGDGEQVATCVGPCERLQDSLSSEGCSFFTTSMYLTSAPEKYPDAIVVGNPQLDRDATVTLNWIPFGSNIEQIPTEIAGNQIENPVVLAPGESVVFELDPDYTLYEGQVDTSLFRSGSVYHVTSDLPVVAYLHSPNNGTNSNASTLLLPESVLTGSYVVYSHMTWIAPNYFTVIAVEDQTTVTWYPSVETAGDGLPLDFVPAGGTGMQLMNRFDNMRIDSSAKLGRPKCEQDMSGTIVEADKPIWLVSGIRALRLPYCGSAADPGCESVTTIDSACDKGSDFAMEQNLPLDYWGREYVGPHSPVRGTEHHWWRLYAGEDDITITVTPAQPNTPVHLAKRGDHADIIVDTGTNLVFNSTGVFMPIQWITTHQDSGTLKGSPGMVQMVPTAQFLDRYVFVTANNYTENYVQAIRAAGGADVVLDGATIANDQWETVGAFEVATVLIDEGPHEIHSNDEFGIIQYGYSNYIDAYYSSAGYGYPGGMKAEVIYVP